MVADCPEANCADALTCVGTVTGNDSPAFGPDPITRGLARLGPDRGHGGDRPEHRDESRQVVRPDVEQRARALGEEERRIGMPGLRPRQLHKNQRCQRRADVSAFDHPARGLQARTQNGVRGTADSQTRSISLFEHGLAAGRIQRQRLLVPDVLAGGNGLAGHLGVGGRDCQVDHDLDVWMLEDSGHSPTGGHRVFRSLGRSRLGNRDRRRQGRRCPGSWSGSSDRSH